MIIRALEVENWRCIPRARITEIPVGVVVIYGPNRSGKSSLFDAVRYCLYDYDHDTGAQAISSVVPWATKGIPKVVVDFEVGGSRHRITKVFSRGKEGMAFLERWADGDWVPEVREPKEASRRVRELLGAEKSFGGINQLLWLPQGLTKLPRDEKLDGSVEKRLENVLGTLVTGHDLDFRKTLEKRCGRWFTVKTKQHRRDSPVQALRGQKRACEGEFNGVSEKLDALDGLVKQFEDTELEIRGVQREVKDAEAQVLAIEKEQQESKDRRDAHRKAAAGLEDANKRLGRAEEALNQYKKKADALLIAQKELDDSQGTCRNLGDQVQELTGSLGAAQDKTTRARQVEEEHAEGRVKLDDRKKLLDLHSSVADLTRQIEEANHWEGEVKKNEGLLAGPAAPSEKELKELRELAETLRGLRASLQAAGIFLRVMPENEATAQVTADKEPPETVDLPPNAPRDWSARQSIKAAISGFGTLEVGRGKENLDIEETARRLQRLDHEYRQRLERWAEDPSDQGALDRLAERRIQRQSWAKNLKEAKDKLGQLAPHGLPGLGSELEELGRAREAILKQHPDLTEWEPDANELAELNNGFERERKRLAKARQDAAAAEPELKGKLDEAEAKRRTAQDIATRKRTDRDRLQGQFDMAGDLTALDGELAGAKSEKEGAEKDAVATALTDAEQTIDDRLGIARGALAKREDRLRTAEAVLNQCFGELRGSEGLHTDRVRREQELNAVTQHLQEEDIEADAHALLLRLFDECRDSHVHRTMGPIEGRVLHWANHLGLEEYREVSFTSGYLPDGLIREGAAPGEEPVPLERESFGTEEQLALLVRLALGNLLAQDEPQAAILDDPLAHADSARHQRMLDILRWASDGSPSGHDEGYKFGRLQLFVLTCHPERFDYLPGATQIDFLQARRA